MSLGEWGSTDLANKTNAFWNYVASRHKNDTHVLFEFMNEPTEPRARTLTNWNNWKTWAQQFVNTIRNHAPDNIILVGSPHWSQLCQFTPQSPFTGTNLVYVMHLYPAWNSSEWPTLFGNAANSVPIFVSEWGYGSYTTADGHASNSAGHEYHGTTSGFGVPFKSYINSLPNVSWTAWVYHWGWNPPMIDQNYNLRGGDRYMGQHTATWLYEERNSDLPNSTTVGVTGVSVSPTSTLYPNPSDGVVKIRLNRTEPESIVSIYDANGKLVYTKILSETNDIAIRPQLPPRVYRLKVNRQSSTLIIK